MDSIIKPINSLRGEIALPGDKSISHRVVFLGAISKGRTSGKNFLNAEDCMRTVAALSDMGIDIKVIDKKITIDGRGLRGLKKPDRELYLGNSGTTMRILPGILSGQDFQVTLTGDDSLSKRPMNRIVEPLQKMGVEVHSKNPKGFPPLTMKGGKVNPLNYSTKVASAQIKSCILFAGLYAGGVTSVTEPFLSRDHTERMMACVGAKISRQGLKVSVDGGQELEGREFFVPGDISSAAFFIAAALILEGSLLKIRDVGLNPTRTGFLEAVSKKGGNVKIANKNENSSEPYGDVEIKYSSLKGITIEKENVPLLIDEIPILAVLASRAEGRSVIKGVAELRVKETDRIFSMVENLRKMGASITENGDDITIDGARGRFAKAKLKSFGDHRTAMSMAVAALFAEGDSVIEDTACVKTSFPEFFDMLSSLGS